MKYIVSYIKIFLVGVITFFFLVAVLPAMYLKPLYFNSFAITWSKLLLFILGIKVQKKGGVPQDNTARIYAVNHSSYIDIPIILATLKTDLRIIYKKELENIFFFGFVLKKSSYVSINRSNPRDAIKSIAEGVNQIKQGASIIVFPEGTRQKDGKIGEFKRGAFMLAGKAEVDIVPVRIIGAHDIIGSGNSLSSKTVQVIIGEEVKLPKPYNKENERKISEKIRQFMINAE